MFEQFLKISEFFFTNEDIDTSKMTIVYELEQDEYELLEKELYVRKNGSLRNFTKNDEVILNLIGVNFIFKKKE
jgi:hypothetical protein